MATISSNEGILGCCAAGSQLRPRSLVLRVERCELAMVKPSGGWLRINPETTDNDRPQDHRQLRGSTAAVNDCAVEGRMVLARAAPTIPTDVPVQNH